MKIALIETDHKSLISILISLVTKSSYSHSIVEIGGVWVDASESRGNFGVADPKDYSDRECIIWEIPHNKETERAMRTFMGKEYDYRGVIGWIFSKGDHKRKFYCYEATLELLGTVAPYRKKDRYSAKDILFWINTHNAQLVRMGKGIL